MHSEPEAPYRHSHTAHWVILPTTKHCTEVLTKETEVNTKENNNLAWDKSKPLKKSRESHYVYFT